MYLMLFCCFHLLTIAFGGRDVFHFIKDLYTDLDYMCVTIVVDNVATLDSEMIDLLVKQEHMLIQFMEVKHMMKTYKEGKFKRQCIFFIFGDILALLESFSKLDELYFKIHHWYFINQDVIKDWEVKFQLDSNVFLVMLDPSLNVQITEIYHINQVLFSNKVGSWCAATGLKMVPQTKLERRSNLGGTVLRAIFQEETGYTVLSHHHNKGMITERNIRKVPWIGFVPDIFNSLAIKLNFSYDLSKPRDGKWGAINEHGEWNGLIKDLIDHERDIASSSLMVSHQRSAAVDFITPFQIEIHSFFIATQSSSYSFDIFHKSFSLNTWITLCIVAIMMGFMIFFIAWKGQEKYFPEFSLSKSFIFVYGAYGGFSSRRWSVTPSNTSARIVFIIVVIFGCLNHWHWKASLISHLSVVEQEVPFRSLAELIASPYQVTTLADSSYQDIWERGSSNTYQDVWNTKFVDKEKSLKKTEEEAVQQALSGQYAIYLMHTTLTNLQQYKSCILEGTDLFVDKIDLAFALRKNSPYLDVFNLEMQRMFESGELERIARRHRTKKPTCNDSGKGKPLGFTNIILMFVIFSGGVCFSIVIFIGELFLSHKNYGFMRKSR